MTPEARIVYERGAMPWPEFLKNLTKPIAGLKSRPKGGSVEHKAASQKQTIELVLDAMRSGVRGTNALMAQARVSKKTLYRSLHRLADEGLVKHKGSTWELA